MILGQKSYQRVALTLESVCDEKNYSTEGIEFISRVKIFPMLPKLDPKSDFGYYPVIQFFDKTILTEAAKTLVDCEYTPQDISSKTRESIAKYLKAHQKINEPSPV